MIDRGVFPEGVIRENYPLDMPSRVDDATDPRRVRAFVLRELEKAALEGHTLQSRQGVIQHMRELEVQPACRVTGDLLNTQEEDFADLIYVVSLENGEKAYQLDRFHAIGRLIKRAVDRRMRARRHEAQIDWADRLKALFGPYDPATDEVEHEARIEKAAALEELFASRFSVLIGPAGTGKTTLLKVLCEEPEVDAGGVLLLAPTGKARARMQIQTGIQGAETVAQFLLPMVGSISGLGRMKNLARVAR